MNLSGSAIGARSANFTENGNLGHCLEVEPRKYTNGVERLELGSRFRVFQSGTQVKAFYCRMVVRWIEADDLRVSSGRLRQQIRIGSDHFGQLHVLVIGEFAGPQDVTFEIDSVLIKRSDWENVDGIARLDGELRQLLLRFGRIATRGRYVQTQHRVRFVCFEALHLDVSQGRGWQNSTRQLQRCGQIPF